MCVEDGGRDWCPHVSSSHSYSTFPMLSSSSIAAEQTLSFGIAAMDHIPRSDMKASSIQQYITINLPVTLSVWGEWLNFPGLPVLLSQPQWHVSNFCWGLRLVYGQESLCCANEFIGGQKKDLSAGWKMFTIVLHVCHRKYGTSSSTQCSRRLWVNYVIFWWVLVLLALDLSR